MPPQISLHEGVGGQPRILLRHANAAIDGRGDLLQPIGIDSLTHHGLLFCLTHVFSAFIDLHGYIEFNQQIS
jgi:hypothetical protein